MPTGALGEWRARLLQATLTATAGLAVLAYIPSVLAAVEAKLWAVVAIDTIAWAVAISLALARRLPYAVRGWGLVALTFCLGLALIQLTGARGGGELWLMSGPVLAAVFFGLRSAVFCLVAVLAATIGVGVLIHLEQIGPRDDSGLLSYELGGWIATASSLLFLDALLSVSVSYLLRGLERSVAQATDAQHATAQANRQLQQEMAHRQEVESKLLRSQKMEALGTLAGGIAHDFNNLLTPILLDTAEVRDSLPADSAHRADLDAVLHSAARARDLVGRILTFSRGGEPEPVPVDLKGLITEVGSLLRSTMPATIGLDYDLGGPDGLRVLADPGELHQILMNLGTNAYLAMRPAGGTLTLGCAPAPDGRSVLITLSDTGPGMPPEVRDRAFDPFFTTRPAGEGTGLGLAIVHRLVTGMGGTVAIDSTPGVGTDVHVTLPRTADAAVAASPTPGSPDPGDTDDAGSPTRRDTARILLVDDEPTLRHTTGMVLTSLGYEVAEQSSPEAALRHLEGHPDHYDLLITDQAMPGMTGLDLTRHVRRLQPDLPVLLSSGYLEEDVRRRAAALNITGVLQKPFDRTALAEAVRSALDPDTLAHD